MLVVVVGSGFAGAAAGVGATGSVVVGAGVAVDGLSAGAWGSGSGDGAALKSRGGGNVGGPPATAVIGARHNDATSARAGA